MTGYQILHFDLAQPLPALALGQQPIYSLFWWHDIPLGSAIILPADLPLSSAALATLATQTISPVVQKYLQEKGIEKGSKRDSKISSLQLEDWLALAAPLEQIFPQSATASDSAAISVSLVVCTRDRPEQLVGCLRSLQALSPPADEIIVVDNAPTDTATRDLVHRFAGIRYVHEPQPGLSNARNSGISHSKGDIVVFTDDDVCVHPRWLPPIKAAFAASKVMAVTGIVIPTELKTDSQILFEFSYGYLHNGYQPQTFDETFFKQHQRQGVPVWDIGAGANMAFRREIFEKVGAFDPRLGAGAAGCSEDSEMWYRILAAGWHCQYVPAAVVYHTHRESDAALDQQMRAYMQGHVTALLVQFAQFRHWGNLRRLFFSLPKYLLRLLITAIRRRFRARHRTYWSEVSGYFSGFPTYFRLAHLSPKRFHTAIVNESSALNKVS